MKYNDQARLDPSQMGGGGRGGGGGIALGGGAGLVVVVIALLLGINPGDLLGGQQPARRPGIVPLCAMHSRFRHRQGPQLPVRRVHQLDPGLLERRVPDYQVINVETFSGSVETACGNATSSGALLLPRRHYRLP